MAVIQRSEGSLLTPAPPSLGNRFGHNETTSAAKGGVRGGWVSGEMLSQAGWALLLHDFNIRVLHHPGCAPVRSSAPDSDSRAGEAVDRGSVRTVLQWISCYRIRVMMPFQQHLTKNSAASGCPVSNKRLPWAWESPEKWM